MTLVNHALDFALPDEAMATLPAEKRGSGRDDVRLMVARRFSPAVGHDTFARFDRHLHRGDVLVVNTSTTLPASIDARTADGVPVRIHFASPTSSGVWVVEVRRPLPGGGTAPGPDIDPQAIQLPGDVQVRLLARSPRSQRLWLAAVDGTDNVAEYLTTHGRPIRYIPGPELSIDEYQTIFASDPGSAEMASAGRPFTTQLLARLVSRGVAVVPVVLHAGVSSYEDGEQPGEERYRVPPASATVINALRATGGTVIAVGTTVVRALESVVDDTGVIHPGQGVTDLTVTPETGVGAVDGLLTGWHEPRSSHLNMLEAFVPGPRLQDIYDLAIAEGYLWHEFGDLLLIVP